ncbi:hypothetical protein DL93DRAFT_2174194, partial [Clavulina sp. PMI_390]
MAGDKKYWQNSLIHSLPDELILAIFHHLRKHHDWTDLAMLKSSVTVSQVCSRWRAIALEASILWSEIIFLSPDIGNLHLAKHSRTRMAECLVRSRSHPLNIHVDLFAYDRDAALRLFNQFVNPHLWRCRILEITVSNREPAYAIFPIPSDLSCIQSFGVAMQWDLSQDSARVPSETLISGPPGTRFAPKRLRLDATVPVGFPDIDTSNLEDLYIADQDIGY